MPKLSLGQKTFLAEATSRYHRSLDGSPAADLLEARSLTEAASPYRLGYVEDPLPGHEPYRGRLCIPYLRRSATGEWCVVSMRFRCVRPGCRCEHHAKYLSQAGDPPRLYNTAALLRDEDTVAICEGELDALSASIAGVPAVGVAGVEAWKPHFRDPFLGYETVFVLADGDEPGMRFATQLAKALPNIKIMPSAPGEDVNSELVKHGKEFIKRKVSV
jgi:5S rRNA maturation endonuclease (ribonuclease M5)